ncbi:unnamed protein product, partial [Closterium sp. Yama58-4]
MADLHQKFASLGFDDAAAHGQTSDALENESREAPVAAATAADDDDGVDDLSDRLSRVVREATTEQQRLDAIASTVFAANAMCFWPDSDAHRPQRAFGFRVLRAMPPAAESLEMRGELGGGRAAGGRAGECAAARESWGKFEGDEQLGCSAAMALLHLHTLAPPLAHSPPMPTLIRPPLLYPSHSTPSPHPLFPHPLFPLPPMRTARPHLYAAHSIPSGTFVLMERSSGRAPSTDWESFGGEKSHKARSVTVTVLPLVLPWLSASAAATLQHGCVATHVAVHSTRTKSQGTQPQLAVSAAAPITAAPHGAAAGRGTGAAGGRAHTQPALTAWEYYLCEPLPLCRRSTTLPQAPSEPQPPSLPAAQRVAAQAELHAQPQSPSLSPPSSPAAKTTTQPSVHFHPLTLVYIGDSKLPPPHSSPAAPATTPCSAAVALLPTAASADPDTTSARASPCQLPSPRSGSNTTGSSSQLSASPTVPFSPAPLIVPTRAVAPLSTTPSSSPPPCSAPSPCSATQTLVDIMLIRDITSFVSQRVSSNVAKEASRNPQGVSDASGHGSADTDAPGLSDEDVEELNGMLKRWGVDADARHLDSIVDEYGRTVLHVAARDGDVLVVQALLGLGMPAGLRTHNGSTPMHRAAWGGHVPCMQVLKRYGADILAKTDYEWTPLHNAARQQQWDAVE